MTICFGREICGELAVAQQREWLVTNGIGGYASGTIAGLHTRGYHGLLVAALHPPLGRTLLVSHLDETVRWGDRTVALATHRWADGSVSPQGFQYLEEFALEGTVPCWRYALADALLEKQVWMQREANTTIIRYHLVRGCEPLRLSLKAFVNYRDYHSRTRAGNWGMTVETIEQGRGVRVTAFEGAVPVYLTTDHGIVAPAHTWHYGVKLPAEGDRGLFDLDDVLQVATMEATLHPGDYVAIVASTEPPPSCEVAASLKQVRLHEQQLLQVWQVAHPAMSQPVPEWIERLVWAADQFIVNRPIPNQPSGKTIIAGYHWFADWGRDTMISLPGLTLTTGRPDIARAILSTFATYISRGMLPNRFPDQGNPLTDADYNTVDATLWYVEAVRRYQAMTDDLELLGQLFPVLQEIIDWHLRGTRFQIHYDSSDGLLYAGEMGVQLTWMDAKIGDWVITPRIGKPVEINALWYCALRSMTQFAQRLGQPWEDYRRMAEVTLKGFTRFWNGSQGYCFDVLDTPSGSDDTLRPNQLLAISLPAGCPNWTPLLSLEQQRQVVTHCGRSLLTSHGLRSLSPDHPNYAGHYSGDSTYRDRVYHQGTVWSWLLGSFALAHYAAFQERETALQFLRPIAHHLQTAGLGSISEIFDGDPPMRSQGCIAQAWSVAEVLRAWVELQEQV